ncbi:MAG: hypothetical protein Q8T03_10600 [Bacteroidota bacterium]|nr:hypothetical protein [Bacteroidota bacterium]
MRKVLVFIIIILLASFKHPFYLGVVDLKYNAKEKMMQGSVKLFTNDFEAALKKKYKKPIDLINTKDNDATAKILFDYLIAQLKFKVNNKSLSFKLIGFEHEADAIWMYIEFDKVDVPKNIEVDNTLLYDYLKDQMNIVHIEVNGAKKSLKVVNPEKTLKFDF